MHSVRNIWVIGLGMAAAAAAQHQPKTNKSPENPSTSSATDDHMGPAAFMWPPDRVWSGDMDNQAPCGSRAAAGNRTKFPLTGGAVALVAQDDYYNSKISISYSNDPKTNTDFSTLVETTDISDLNPGHTCVQIPDAPSRVVAGSNATLQIIYKADWDAPHNQTFYACADVTYVVATDFNSKIPCFNATEPGDDDKAAANGANKPSSGGASGSDSSPSSGSSSSSGGSKMGAGAMAGVIVGSLVGASMLAASLILYRRRQQKKRSLRLARMEENARRGQYPLDKVSSQSSV
ncbi:cytokine inducing-glycoprotein [Hirsutella rhossiliensis]|uniref:Cytokine inducing-glycoprotein n=1 Tax=Hirsutella rhossiliensis TaxID=111463 RepID=A0A9P8SG89_9HYPO|nr:cytokine inducing-glycoprotein [Hirsutella rhossiliensis]KAH0961531.1 cytokine inducing-glycoprotein [Hirsutella rhossiliensis]